MHQSLRIEDFRQTAHEFALAPDFDFSVELLATLGEWLSLHRFMIVATPSGTWMELPDGAGPALHDALLVGEVDQSGRIVRQDMYSVDRLDDALHRLFERYAELTEDAAEAEWSRSMMSSCDVWRTLNDRDLQGFEALAGQDHYNVDHRPANLGRRNIHETLGGLRALLELAPDAMFELTDVLAVDLAGVALYRFELKGHLASGGAFDRSGLAIAISREGGHDAEVFDDEQLHEAFTRFDEIARNLSTGSHGREFDVLTTSSRRRPPRPNPASRAIDSFVTAIDSGYVVGVTDVFAPGVVRYWHQPQPSSAPDELLGDVVAAAAAPDVHASHDLVATLGDTLSLHRITISGLALDHVVVAEVDPSGRLTRLDRLPGERLVDAVHRLLERYAEVTEDPRSAGRTRRLASALDVTPALNARDWQRVKELIGDRWRSVDHRHDGVGIGNIVNSAELALRRWEVLVELPPTWSSHTPMCWLSMGAVSCSARSPRSGI